jgi:hypothetical protein
MSETKKAAGKKAGDRKAKVKKLVKEIANRLHAVVAMSHVNY